MKEIKTKEEASKIRNEIIDLAYKSKYLQKPLDKWNEKQILLKDKEQFENRVFHNPIGTGIIYVQEVTKYDCRCIMLNSGYDGMSDKCQSVVGYNKYGAQFAINVSVSFKNMRNTSEWKGVGNRKYIELIEQVENLKEFFIDKNKSI